MRETPKCRASPRALRWVASGGRVFSVASRIFCSSSEVSIRRDRCRFGDWPRASQPPREKGRARRQDGWPGQPGLLRNGVVGKSLARQQNDATLPSYPLWRRARAQDSNCRFRVKWDGTLV